MPLGGIITILVLLPNLLVLFYPPVEVPSSPNQKKTVLTRVMEVLERVGQVGSFGIPFFYALNFDLSDSEIQISLAIMVLALGFYYAGWARYLLKGHRFELLYKPLLRFPLPMAVSPVIFFLAASILLQSVYLALAALALGVGHIYVSYFEFKRVTV